MAYNIVIQTLRLDKTHSLSTDRAARRIKALDPVNVFIVWDGLDGTQPDNTYFPMQKTGNAWVPSVEIAPVWAFVVVTGIPDNVVFQKIVDALLSAHADFDATESITVDTLDYLDIIGNPSKYPQYQNPANAVDNGDGTTTLNIQKFKTFKRKNFGRQTGFANPQDALPNNKKTDYLSLGYITLSLTQAVNIFYNKKELRNLDLSDFV